MMVNLADFKAGAAGVLVYYVALFALSLATVMAMVSLDLKEPAFLSGILGPLWSVLVPIVCLSAAIGGVVCGCLAKGRPYRAGVIMWALAWLLALLAPGSDPVIDGGAGVALLVFLAPAVAILAASKAGSALQMKRVRRMERMGSALGLSDDPGGS